MTAPDILAASDALAGPAALLVVLVLLIATVFLIRNMDKRLRRLPKEFPVDGKGGTSVHEELPPQA
jgi:hypothetical protein